MKTKFTVPEEISVSVETITPSIAKKMLEGNVDNRKLRKFRVEQYADAIRRGMWDIQNDAITISKTGRLLNGQHRLSAIVEANTAVQCLVLRGVDDSTFATIDSGLARTANDALFGVLGAGINVSHISPIAKMLIAFDCGLNIFDTNAMSLVQRQDIVDYVGKNTELLEWAKNIGAKADKFVGGIRTAWGVFAVLCAAKHGKEKTEEFINLVLDGVGLKPGDAPLALRNWLSRQRGALSRDATKNNIAVFIGIFNKWMTNEKTSVVRSYSGAWENFPEII
jgi:hypothetical protein